MTPHHSSYFECFVVSITTTLLIMGLSRDFRYLQSFHFLDDKNENDLPGVSVGVKHCLLYCKSLIKIIKGNACFTLAVSELACHGRITQIEKKIQEPSILKPWLEVWGRGRHSIVLIISNCFLGERSLSLLKITISSHLIFGRRRSAVKRLSSL